jgi:thiamine kinase-like enzyme
LYSKNKVIHLEENGKMIKTWIEGWHPNLNKEDELKLVLDELIILHQIKIPLNTKIPKVDWKAYFKFNTLNQKYLDYFLTLTSKYKYFTPCINHHDLNSKNILIDKNTCTLIDFEWIRINSRYFDFASLALQSPKSKEFIIEYANLDAQTLNDYQDMILIYAHMWANYMQTAKAKKYQASILDLLDKMLVNN